MTQQHHFTYSSTIIIQEHQEYQEHHEYHKHHIYKLYLHTIYLSSLYSHFHIEFVLTWSSEYWLQLLSEHVLFQARFNEVITSSSHLRRSSRKYSAQPPQRIMVAKSILGFKCSWTLWTTFTSLAPSASWAKTKNENTSCCTMKMV